MAFIRKLSNLAVVASAAVTFSGAYIVYNSRRLPAHASGHRAGVLGELDRLLFEPSSVQWDSNWDLRETGTKKPRKKDSGIVENDVEGSKEIKPTGIRHLVFIRHGQYYDSAKKDEDKRLTELGRIQANQTGQRLQSLNIKYTKLVCSTLIRATETADIIAQQLPNVPRETCDLLREGAPIVPEPPSSSNWRPAKREFFQDGPRIEAAFRRHLHRADPDQVGDSVEIYVCHANVIRYFVCRVLQFPPEGWLRMSIGHCGITWVTIRPNGRVSLKCMGDTGHITPENLSS
ncbi:unnamed protein product [Porites evermanni]|uniref:Serine/threonine-protein phosphatase PGAM5, mitochondrial n=1 Tax=Porites evermanni TaxID=104178 RepID=A0ABN8T320_9CNID|nr:unnamed protein product [Porites evermanni]